MDLMGEGKQEKRGREEEREGGGGREGGRDTQREGVYITSEHKFKSSTCIGRLLLNYTAAIVEDQRTMHTFP
jgi:hypothetical protein